MPYSDLYLTSKEVAMILRVSTRTIYNYRTERRIPFIKVEKKILYKVSDVVNLLNESSCCSYQKDRINSLIEKCIVKDWERK